MRRFHYSMSKRVVGEEPRINIATTKDYHYILGRIHRADPESGEAWWSDVPTIRRAFRKDSLLVIRQSSRCSHLPSVDANEYVQHPAIFAAYHADEIDNKEVVVSLNVICTFKPFRREGYATIIIEAFKSLPVVTRITAECITDDSIEFMKNRGFEDADLRTIDVKWEE